MSIAASFIPRLLAGSGIVQRKKTKNAVTSTTKKVTTISALIERISLRVTCLFNVFMGVSLLIVWVSLSNHCAFGDVNVEHG